MNALRGWLALAWVLSLMGAAVAGNLHGHRAERQAVAAEKAQATADATRQELDAERRVHAADIDIGRINLDSRVRIEAVRVQLPVQLEESRHAIATAPVLGTVRLPAGLVRLRQQQAADSAAIAASTAATER